MNTTIIKKISILALAIMVISCKKEETTPTTTPAAPTPPVASSPFNMTVGGTAYNFTSSQLYGLYDTNNEDINVKTTPGADPIGAGGFAFTDLYKDATAGLTDTMEEFDGPNLFFADNAGGIHTSVSGMVTYTSHNKTARTIAGTFNCVVKNPFTNTTQNVAGSFDFAYPTDFP